MRWGTLVSMLGAVAVAFSAGVWAAQPKAGKLDPLTQKNLDTAMHGEAFAHAKYLLFAAQAKQAGHPEVAAAFEKAATAERLEHFKEEAELSGLVGTVAENLRNAIEGESYESTTMYPKFAAQARSAGHTAVAERFEEIARDEHKHRSEFESLLKRLEPGAQGRGSTTR